MHKLIKCLFELAVLKQGNNSKWQGSGPLRNLKTLFCFFVWLFLYLFKTLFVRICFFWLHQLNSTQLYSLSVKSPQPHLILYSLYILLPRSQALLEIFQVSLITTAALQALLPFHSFSVQFLYLTIFYHFEMILRDSTTCRQLMLREITWF